MAGWRQGVWKATVLAAAIGLLLGWGGGCGPSRPDPREQPGFKDTTDPSAIPQLPENPEEEAGGQGGEVES